MTSTNQLLVDDINGSVHVCRPVQALCRPDCTIATGQDKFISESENEMVSSSPGVQTSESACTSVQHVMNPLYFPENFAHIPSKSYIFLYFKELGVNLPYLLCMSVCTPPAQACNVCTG